MTDEKLDLPQGTPDLLILKTRSLGPQHDWAISERLYQVSRITLQIPQGLCARHFTVWSAATGFA